MTIGQVELFVGKECPLNEVTTHLLQQRKALYEHCFPVTTPVEATSRQRKMLVEQRIPMCLTLDNFLVILEDDDVEGKCVSCCRA